MPDDVAAERHIASMEHDLRMLAEADPNAKYRIDTEGGEKTIADIPADLDADEAAIEATRGCL